MAGKAMPAYVLSGFPTTVEELSALEAEVPVAAALHIEVTDEALEQRLPERSDGAWDYFDTVERELSDAEITARLHAYYSQTSPLLQQLAQQARLRTVSVWPGMQTAVSQAVGMLRGIDAPTFAAPKPSLAIVLGGAGSGSSCIASQLAAELGFGFLQVHAWLASFMVQRV